MNINSELILEEDFMAKISPVAAKYIVHSTITIDGIVDRPDVIGAIFGQTEGLLGADLELRELQRSGRIGRIEVNMNTISGKTSGEIIIPSSLDKTETAIVAAALEIIQRIGPCNAKIEVHKIEDVRTLKRQFVIERAKELLRELTEETLPDSQELSDEVSQSVRMMEVCEYGKEKLAAGPSIDDNDELILVEGRADVLNLLKHGFKNAIAMNGTSAPQTIRDLSRRKTITVFVDGDRGGDLIVRELLANAEIDFVTKAPDGKEVEELAKKEIHKSLRSRITAEQAKMDLGIDEHGQLKDQEETLRHQPFKTKQQQGTSLAAAVNASSNSLNASSGAVRGRLSDSGMQQGGKPSSSHAVSTQVNSHVPAGSSLRGGAPMIPNGASRPRELVKEMPVKKTGLADEKKIFKETLENLFGTRGACIFDAKLSILGKVPLSELPSTIKSLNGGVYAIALDGVIEPELVKLAEKINVSYLIGSSSKHKESTKVQILTEDKL